MSKKPIHGRNLTLADKIKLYEFLKTIIKKDGDFVEYAEDWSDLRVAKQFNIKPSMVTKTRLETFGKLSTARGDHFVPYPKLVERVSKLEAMVMELVTELRTPDEPPRPYTNGHSNQHRVGA
jgi:hypothetical protein